MGRHAIVTSPLRSPAVVIGVPVAAALATMGSNAVLGGVVPSAEEVPLRAESAAAPAAVDAPPGPPSWPTTSSPTPPDVVVDAGRSDDVPVAASPDDVATGAIRVVLVGDETVTAPSARGIRVVHEGPDRASDAVPDHARRPVARPAGADDRPSTRRVAAVEPVTHAVSSPAAGSRSASTMPATSTASGMASGTAERLEVAPIDATSGDEDEDGDDSPIGADSPAGGLSILSFG